MERRVVHPLKIIFNRQSEFIHKFDNDDDEHQIKHLESALIASTPTNNHIFKSPANKQISIFSVEINRKLFENKIESFLPNMNDDLQELFKDVKVGNIRAQRKLSIKTCSSPVEEVLE